MLRDAFFRGRGAEPRAPASAAPRAAAPAKAPPPVAATPPADPTGGRDDDGPITSFADIPKYQRVLSGGEDPLVRLTSEERAQLAVVEVGGGSALLIHCDRADADQSLVAATRGTLATAGYHVRIRPAPRALIRELYEALERSDMQHGKRRVGNRYIDEAKSWFLYGVENRATDVHLETRGSAGVVRFRIDGELERMRSSNKGEYPAPFLIDCMAALYNNAQQAKSGNRSSFLKEENLSCMVPVSDIPGHNLKLRYQSLKGNDGPKAILRILHVGEDKPTLGYPALGYAPSQVQIWKEVEESSSGLVILSGVTGSGKTTTMKSFIELNPLSAIRNILTLEDPIEYPIRFAHQVHFQRDLSDPAASRRALADALGSFMRADPDVVAIGEVRDRISSLAAQQIAESGHMAMGTLHAHLLSGMVPRLVNEEIGMSRSVLAAPKMISLLVYQALVPVLCPHCAQTSHEVERDLSVQTILDSIQELGLDAGLLRWKRPDGCRHCHGRGTVGQTVVAEMFVPDDDWLRAIRENRDGDAEEVYRSYSNRDLTHPDMTGKTVFEHTLFKALQGHVDPRRCTTFDTWPRYMRRHRKLASKG